MADLDTDSDAVIKRILQQVLDSGPRAAELLRRVRDPFDKAFRRDSRLHRKFARALIAIGQPAAALEVCQDAFSIHGRRLELELRYLIALAASRRGDWKLAAEEIEGLSDHPALDPDLQVEVLSLEAKVKKAKITGASSLEERSARTGEAARAYAAVYERSKKPFPGINAATLYRLLGSEDGDVRSRELAREILATLEQETPEPKDAHWHWATRGEASLLLGELDEAVSAYQHACTLAGPRAGDVLSMRGNVELLAEVISPPPGLLEMLTRGRVVVFAGHMVDTPGREIPRFPADPDLEEAVRLAIGEQLDDLEAVAGYSSIACGSDVLFAEEMLRREAELHLVLPFDEDDFFAQSVNITGDERAGWGQRAENALAKARAVHHATIEPFLDDTELFRFVNQVTQGLGVVRAKERKVEAVALVVREPEAPALVGGTSAFLHEWTSRGRAAREIDLAALRRAVIPRENRENHQARETSKLRTDTPAPPSARARSVVDTTPRVIRVMLFADVKGFSKITEAQAPAFFVRFLQLVRELIAASETQPVVKNTWGDGLFLVFEDVVPGADFALRLTEETARQDWTAAGLPPKTTVRVGIHAGPVYPAEDPIRGQPNFFGSHVNRAARIEPVTEEGCVFASEQLAALLALEPGHDITSEYMGIRPLAKGFGSEPLYRLRRR